MMYEINQCNCLNSCVVTQAIRTYDTTPNSEIIFEISVVNQYVRSLQEHFSYDIIFLLCDIGGNIGLYFGMSCLTIIEIFVHFHKMFFTSFNNKPKSYSKLREKIKMVLEKKLQETEKQSFVKKTLKITISLILLCISAYQIYYLIDSYFEYPLYKTVSLVRDDIIQFPLIITCDEESHEILND
uniref:Uncharacterized protein n=1 Tax=Strigamia maritima TaxID=126957 RepID=T1JFH9_STRMM